MIRPVISLLVIVTTLCAPLLSHGQEVEHVGSGFSCPIPPIKSAYASGTQAIVLAKDHVIWLENTKDSGHILHVFDRSGKAQLGEVVTPVGDFEPAFEDLINVGNTVWITYRTWDKKAGAIDVWAQGYGLSDAASQGEPKRIAHLDVAPGKYNGEPLGLHFYRSPDESKTLLYCDALRSAEKEQLILCSVFDQAFELLWQQGFRIAFEADKIATVNAVVSDQGTVYSLMRSRFKNRPITNHNVNYSHELYRFTAESMTSQPVQLAGSAAALTASLMIRDQGPAVLGAFVDPEETTTETTGVFGCAFDPELRVPTPAQMNRFRQPLPYQLTNWRLLKRPSGGAYFVGGSWEVSTHVDERILLAMALDEELRSSWLTSVPRKLRSSYYESYGYRAQLVKDHLMLFFPDGDENLERYRRGQEVELMKDRKRILVRMDLDEQGAPSYRQHCTTEDTEAQWRQLGKGVEVDRVQDKKAGSHAKLAIWEFKE
jgi:hypothetical protein